MKSSVDPGMGRIGNKNPVQKSGESDYKAKVLYAIGLDVGGSRIKAAIVDNHGKLFFPKDFLTERHRDYIVRQILNACRFLLGRAEENPEIRENILGIGIGVTGQVDFSTGTIIAGITDKIPGWIGTPLKTLVGKELNVPVLVDNDGKVATLAEFHFGNYGDFKDMACLTLGSGVGGGLIIDRKLHRPARGGAGELGHIIINFDGPMCGWSHHGCIESYVSNSALVNYARKQLEQERKGKLYDLCEGQLDRLTPELIGEAAREGDPIAKNAINIMANYLGIGLANITTALAPGIIVIGGGLAQLGDLLLKPAQEAMKKYSFGISAKYTKVVLSSLGPYAGVIGAAVLIFHYMPNN